MFARMPLRFLRGRPVSIDQNYRGSQFLYVGASRVSRQEPAGLVVEKDSLLATHMEVVAKVVIRLKKVDLDRVISTQDPLPLQMGEDRKAKGYQSVVWHGPVTATKKTFIQTYRDGKKKVWVESVG